MKKLSAAIFMLALAVICLTAHFIFGWQAFQQEQREHNASAQLSAFLVTWGRDVFENLQSEFLQLFFQFMLLAGAFKFISVKAYEEDQEELKRRLDKIGAAIASQEKAEDADYPYINERKRRRTIPAAEQLAGRG